MRPRKVQSSWAELVHRVGGIDFFFTSWINDRQVVGGGGGQKCLPFQQTGGSWLGGGGHDCHVSRQGGGWEGQKCLPFQQTGGSWPGVTRSWAPALEPESELSAWPAQLSWLRLPLLKNRKQTIVRHLRWKHANGRQVFNWRASEAMTLRWSNSELIMNRFVSGNWQWLPHKSSDETSFVFVFFAVPSTVPTSEALLPRRSSRHPSPPATPRAHSASRPRPQRSTGSDVRSLVGCHPKETLHCCWVTSVVFSSACSDSTYAGHHLLCPLLTTMLAKSRSQTEWASPQRADRRYVPPPILLCGLSDVEGFDQNCPRQGRREEHQDWGHHESVTWRATEAETFFIFLFYFYLCSDRWGWGW